MMGKKPVPISFLLSACEYLSPHIVRIGDAKSVKRNKPSTNFHIVIWSEGISH